MKINYAKEAHKNNLKEESNLVAWWA
jgi:hypothetical protein